MSRTVLSTQVSSYGSPALSSQYVEVLSRMIFDEPCVYGLISTQQTMSLRHGIMDHLNRHYLPFCKDAILLFLAVGFVPFRIRQEGHTRVPEALPLGTFSWTVSPSGAKHRKRTREGAELEPRGAEGGPLLVYDVTCTACKDEIHVYNFVQPHSTLICFSALSTLIAQYNTLRSVRDVALRCMQYNSETYISLEEMEKIPINSAFEKGMSIGNLDNTLSRGVTETQIDTRQEHMGRVVEANKQRDNLPPNARVFVVPKNNTAKALEKVISPLDLAEREHNFARAVAMVLGLPSGGGQGSTSAQRKSAAWNETPEMFTRAILDSCQRINQGLADLLRMAYTKVYHANGKTGEKIPSFYLPVAPNLPYEMLLPMFDANILDEVAYSRLFEASTGFPLGQNAVRAREERHKAATVLPTPAASKDK